jgi:hypothetical protein
MPIANPLVNGSGGRTATPRGGVPPAAAAAGAGGSYPMNTGPFTSESNLPMHVGAIVLIALGIIVLLQLAGFKVVVAGSVGVGR